MENNMVDIASTSRASAHVQTERTAVPETSAQNVADIKKVADDSSIERKEVDAATESHIGQKVDIKA